MVDSWAKAHRKELEKRGSSLEFGLHRMVYLRMLQEGNLEDALSYARENLSPFVNSEMDSIQKLMGCLLYVKDPSNSPYASFFAPAQWTKISHSFTRECCHLLGLSQESPLQTVVTAVRITRNLQLQLILFLRLAFLLSESRNSPVCVCASPFLFLFISRKRPRKLFRRC